ncbi:permease, partial [Klebsiella pneumoniae]|uniref:AI-2E family transporter n=1 Tax=Klebsiella pneumoniae TaxID=573 RepID=UPI001012F980
RRLGALAVILRGSHAAADMLGQLLRAVSVAIVLSPLVTWFIRRGMPRADAMTLVVTARLVMITALLGVLAASLNAFVAMLPDFNRALTRKILQLQEYLPFLNLHINP